MKADRMKVDNYIHACSAMTQIFAAPLQAKMSLRRGGSGQLNAWVSIALFLKVTSLSLLQVTQ